MFSQDCLSIFSPQRTCVGKLVSQVATAPKHVWRLWAKYANRPLCLSVLLLHYSKYSLASAWGTWNLVCFCFVLFFSVCFVFLSACSMLECAALLMVFWWWKRARSGRCANRLMGSCYYVEKCVCACVCVCMRVCVWFVHRDIWGHKEGEKGLMNKRKRNGLYRLWSILLLHSAEVCGVTMLMGGERRSARVWSCCFVQDSDAPLQHIVFQTIAGL